MTRARAPRAPRAPRPPKPSAQHANVLYVDTSAEATLISGANSVTGPLANLKALAAQLKLKGPTVLVTNGEMKRLEIPAGLPEAETAKFLDGYFQDFAVTPPRQHPPELASVHSATQLQTVRTAARTANLHLSTLVPLTTAALNATETTGTVVIVTVSQASYDITVLSGAQVVTRNQPRSDQNAPEETRARNNGLARVVENAVKQLLSNGETPRVIVIGDPPADPPNLSAEVDLMYLPLTEALAGAILKRTPKAPAEELTDTPHPAVTVALLERPLVQRKALDKKLLIALGIAAAINGGLYLFAQSVQAGNATLTEQKAALQVQADQVQALRTANTQLASRNDQAKALTQQKGPLAADLPQLATRITELHGTLQTLGGPNPVQPTDTRAFGTVVNRAYTLTATTSDVQSLTTGFQERGLAADIHDIDCTKGPCVVNLRAAPIDPPLAVSAHTPPVTK